MKVICWNIQGLENKQALFEVKFLIRSHQPDLIFLLETLVNDSNISKILPQLGFDHYDFVSPVNHFGGIAVLWSNGNIHASILLKEQRAIHMMVHDTTYASNSILSGIYAPAQNREKDVFWDQLTQMNKIIDIPCCLIGDFNELVCLNDKLGGPTPNFNRFQRLNKFLACVNAETLQVSGNYFTWKKRVFKSSCSPFISVLLVQASFDYLWQAILSHHCTKSTFTGT